MELTAALATAGLDLCAPFADDDGRQGYVVGNTRAFWPRFVAALPSLLDEPHPIEAYVERVVRAALPTGARVRFAHEGPPWIPIQRLAERAGLAWLSPGRLAVHPVYGPWISLRAVVTLDEAAVAAAAAPAPPCPGCETGCRPAFARASPFASPRAAETHWREWLAVRDACPTGREHRFQEDHLAYGYSKDRRLLVELVSRPRRGDGPAG